MREKHQSSSVLPEIKVKFHRVKQRMGKWEEQRDQNSGLGNKSERTICHVPLQGSVGIFLSNPSHVLTKFMPVPLHVGHDPVYAWRCCTFFLEVFGAAGCRSDIHAPFSRCNPSTGTFWLCSAQDYTWGMAVGPLMNSCFQVTATHSLCQFPRVLLSMCRKLKGSENSINFIIVGEKILQVEQIESHWRMVGLKGRNEVCEHSFRILVFLYWWFYAKSRIGSNFASCSGSNLHQTSWFSAMKMCSRFFLCLQHESQPLLGATVQPRARAAHGTAHLEHVWVQFLCSQGFQGPTCCISCPFNTWWRCPCQRQM